LGKGLLQRRNEEGMEVKMASIEKKGLEHVKYTKKGKIAYVTLNRPEKMNAYTNQTLNELGVCWKDYKNDDSLHVAILSGEGKVFSVGHDLSSGESITTEPPAIHYGDIELYKPIIAAVNGYALGGGCSMALACDIKICGEDARFGYPQAKVGITSIGGPQRLPRLIPGLAQWYLFSGEFITAQEAYRLGLVLKVVPNDRLMEEATKIAERLLESSLNSIMHIKESIERGKLLPLNEALSLSKQITAKAELTEDYQESLRAFAEKRDPAWKNR
jgi:enoyl-CoA hydratase/carnithine racemase